MENSNLRKLVLYYSKRQFSSIINVEYEVLIKFIIGSLILHYWLRGWSFRNFSFSDHMSTSKQWGSIIRLSWEIGLDLDSSAGFLHYDLVLHGISSSPDFSIYNGTFVYILIQIHRHGPVLICFHCCWWFQRQVQGWQADQLLGRWLLQSDLLLSDGFIWSLLRSDDGSIDARCAPH